MAASWRVNTLIGVAAFIFTYFFSYKNNTWQTSLFRAGIGFLIFFMIGYLFRFMLYQLASKKVIDMDDKPKGDNEPIHKDNRTNDVQLSMNDTSFQAISLNDLHNGGEHVDPKTIADTIETWTTQDREG